MRVRPGLNVLTDVEIEKILDSAKQIVSEVGMQIENEVMLQKLVEYGGNRESSSKNVVTFSKKFTERFLAETEKIDWNNIQFKFKCHAEYFLGYYHNPEKNNYEATSMESLEEYVKLAEYLPNIEGSKTLGCPIGGIPGILTPLYEKLIVWKFGMIFAGAMMDTGGCIMDKKLCPYLIEMGDVMADSLNTKTKDFLKVAVYLISPLKFAKKEADQFIYFYEKGYKTEIGNLCSMAGTAPVTPAGALAIQLAEHIFINIIKRAFFGDKKFTLYNTVNVLDMATGSFQYGRPEQSLHNLALAQIARKLGVASAAHCGLADAKVPGYEAAAQKLTSALTSAYASGHGYIAGGLLGTDEIASPIQLIFDNELVGSLKRIEKGFDVNDEEIALDVIREVGHGGTFLSTDHTALNFKESFWFPGIWSKEMYNPWKAAGSKDEIIKAMEIYKHVKYDLPPFMPKISEDTENRLKNVIEKARKELIV